MQARVNRRTQRLNQQVTELAWAVPQVVNERMTRMMFAGPQPSANDQREFHMMGQEKVSAFCESWMAMSQQMVRAQQELYLSWLNSFTRFPANAWTPAKMTQAAQSATLGVLGAGMAPVHSRAVSNARRLRKSGR